MSFSHSLTESITNVSFCLPLPNESYRTFSVQWKCFYAEFDNVWCVFSQSLTKLVSHLCILSDILAYYSTIKISKEMFVKYKVVLLYIFYNKTFYCLGSFFPIYVCPCFYLLVFFNYFMCPSYCLFFCLLYSVCRFLGSCRQFVLVLISTSINLNPEEGIT